MKQAAAVGHQSQEARRILAGDIENLPLPELIQFFHLQGLDGALVLQTPAGEALGALFYRTRRIVHAVYQGIQGSDAVYAAMRLQTGLFEFLAGAHMVPTESVKDSVQNLILEGLRRLDANDSEHLLGLLPDDEQPIFLAPEPPSDDIRLTAKEWRVLSLVNGKRSVQQIIEHSRKQEDEVRAILAGLLTADLILTEKDISYQDAIILTSVEVPGGGVRFAAPTLIGTLILKKMGSHKSLRTLLAELNLPEERVAEDLKALVKLQRIRVLSGHVEFERWASSG
jgi:hypothetical protein